MGDFYPESIEEALEWDRVSDYISEECILYYRRNKKKALPYFLKVLQEINEENIGKTGEESLLTALFLLSEYHCVEAFPEIARLMLDKNLSLDAIGDYASQYNEFLYHTFNGDFDLLHKLLVSENVNGIQRLSPLQCYAQLYLDGIVSRKQMVQAMEPIMDPWYWYDEMFIEALEIAADLGFTEFDAVLRKYDRAYRITTGNWTSLVTRAHSKPNPPKAGYCSAVITMESASYLTAPRSAVKKSLDGCNAHLEWLRQIVSEQKKSD